MAKDLTSYLALAGVIEARRARKTALETEIHSLEIELGALTSVLTTRAEPIVEQCRIPIVIAIREYNAENDSKLGEDINLYIDHDRMVVNIGTTLTHANGREPYDILDDDDGDTYADKIRATADAELKQSDLPFTFGTVRFPGRYYMRLD